MGTRDVKAIAEDLERSLKNLFLVLGDSARATNHQTPLFSQISGRQDDRVLDVSRNNSFGQAYESFRHNCDLLDLQFMKTRKSLEQQLDLTAQVSSKPAANEPQEPVQQPLTDEFGGNPLGLGPSEMQDFGLSMDDGIMQQLDGYASLNPDNTSNHEVSGPGKTASLETASPVRDPQVPQWTGQEESNDPETHIPEQKSFIDDFMETNQLQMEDLFQDSFDFSLMNQG